LLRIWPAHQAARAGREAAALNEEAARRKVASDARVLYYTWVRARLQAAVSEQALVQARGHVTDVKHALGAGTASPADVLRAESQLASAELLRERAQGLATLLEDRVSTAMHDPAGRCYEIGEDMQAEIAPVSGEGDPAALLAEALQHRPEIQALDRTV